MGQRGQHVLIVDDNAARQRVLELIMQRTGRWVTIAENGDEAMAILKSTLHPLIVLLNGRIQYPLDGRDVSLLLTLLGNQEFTTTHAFVMTAPPRSEDERVAIYEAVQNLGADVHVSWLALPGRFVEIVTATNEAERYVQSRA